MYTSLSHFKNTIQGLAFVCGSGTSLLQMPVNLAEHGTVICVNAAGMHFNNYQYLFITDEAVMHMAYWDEVAQKADNIIFASTEFEPNFEKMCSKHAPGKTCYLLTRNYTDHDNYNLNNNVLCIGNDAPMPATHFAYTLGCNPIVLAGIDLCFDKKGTRYFTDKADKHKPTSPYAKSFADGLAKRKLMTHAGETDHWLYSSLPFWDRILNQTPGIDKVIINASKISAITQFKKQDIKDILNEYSKDAPWGVSSITPK